MGHCITPPWGRRGDHGRRPPRLRRDRTAEAARRSHRDPPRGEAPRVHDAAQSAQHLSEGSPGPGSPGNHPASRNRAGPASHRTDLRSATHSPNPGAPLVATRGLDGTVRAHGGAERAGLAHPRRGRGGSPRFLGPSALFQTRRSVGSGVMDLEGRRRDLTLPALDESWCRPAPPYGSRDRSASVRTRIAARIPPRPQYFDS